MKVTALVRKRLALTHCIVACAILVACSPSPPQQDAVDELLLRANKIDAATKDLHPEFRPLVDEYVRAKYGWEQDVFRVWFVRQEGPALAYWVLHQDDYKQAYPGGGKSVEVRVDPSIPRVIAEYHFQ
jgi:hypothetical protein